MIDNLPKEKRSNLKVFSCLVGFSIVFLILIYGWPTRYRYEHIGDNLIRIDRFNEEIQYFTSEGWKTRVEKPYRTVETLQDLLSGLSSKQVPSSTHSQQSMPANSSTYDPAQKEIEAEEFLRRAGRQLSSAELNLIQSSCNLERQEIRCQIYNTTDQRIVAITLKMEYQGGPIFCKINTAISPRQATTLNWGPIPGLEQHEQHIGSITLHGAAVAIE